MPLQNIAKLLIFCGIAAVAIGVLLFFAGKLGMGQLPGDFAWKRGQTSIYFPVATSIIVSIVLTVVVNLVLRFFR